MLVSELAAWIRRNKPGLNYPRVHPCADEGVVVQYTRHEMRGDVHITDEHIFECCGKASSFEEHIVDQSRRPTLKPGNVSGINHHQEEGREDVSDNHRFSYLSNLLLAHPCFYNTGSVVQRNQMRRLLRTEGNPLFCLVSFNSITYENRSPYG